MKEDKWMQKPFCPEWRISPSGFLHLKELTNEQQAV
jgi:hypothetical protein